MAGRAIARSTVPRESEQGIAVARRILVSLGRFVLSAAIAFALLTGVAGGSSATASGGRWLSPPVVLDAEGPLGAGSVAVSSTGVATASWQRSTPGGEAVLVSTRG